MAKKTTNFLLRLPPHLAVALDQEVDARRTPRNTFLVDLLTETLAHRLVADVPADAVPLPFDDAPAAP